MNFYDNFQTDKINTSKLQSGWLDTNGVFYKCGWGEHCSLAYELINKSDNRYEEYRKSGLDANDFLVKECNWILLDNPNGDEETQNVTYNPLKRKTNRQLDKIYKLFNGCNKMIEYIFEVFYDRET